MMWMPRILSCRNKQRAGRGSALTTGVNVRRKDAKDAKDAIPGMLSAGHP